MSDFDFDELDKAVAGVIGPEEPTARNTDSVTPVSPVTPANPVNLVSSTSQPAPVASAPETPAVHEEPKEEVAVQQRATLAPAARRSSGRFMDVVHPSSDMRTRTGYTPAAEAPAASRTTTFVTPATEETPEEDWSKPLESPFLPDAKVEKRPLGGSGPAPAFHPEELLEAPEDELKLEEPDDPRLEATTLPDPIDFALQSTQELTSDSELEQPLEDVLFETTADTVAVESITTVESEADSQSIADELIVDEPVVEQPSLAVEQPVEAPEQPAGPTSISQQYQERPSEAQASGAIYDTENYHQPMTPAPKKHGSAWSIVWIVLLVILGAGAGVGFYLFVLPML